MNDITIYYQRLFALSVICSKLVPIKGWSSKKKNSRSDKIIKSKEMQYSSHTQKNKVLIRSKCSCIDLGPVLIYQDILKKMFLHLLVYPLCKSCSKAKGQRATRKSPFSVYHLSPPLVWSQVISLVARPFNHWASSLVLTLYKRM